MGWAQRHDEDGVPTVTEPILIGVLNDGERPSDLDAGSAASSTYSQLATDMALPIDAAIAAGRIDRDVEFVP
jgi:hypothetical protein